MRPIIITTLFLLSAACGPSVHGYDHELVVEHGSSTGDDEPQDDHGASETGAPIDPARLPGGGSGGGEAGAAESEGSTTGEPAECTLPEAESACWAIVEACEAIDCDSIGGSAWAVVAAQYFLGDDSPARHVASCESDCAELEAACSFVPAGVPSVSICTMASEADCLDNAAADGIPLDQSVAWTCGRLAVL